jgi:DMSO/TMAO reductase YedYZ molybdopterin-dependent catalytic subunit
MKLKFILTGTIVAILLIAFTPTIAADSTIEVTNQSGDTYSFTYQQLEEMPQTMLYAELYCYGSLVASGDWSGVQLSYLLNQSNLSSEVKSIQFTASDSYIVTIPIQLAMAPQTIIAYQKDGDPIPGLRLVLPGVNGASWIAQIVSIAMGDKEVDPPAAASGSGGRSDIVSNLIQDESGLPTPAITPKPTQSIPQSVPDNATTKQNVSPSNTPRPNQTLQPQTENNQSINLDTGTILLIAAIFATGSVIATTLAYKSKTKLKERTQNN